MGAWDRLVGLAFSGPIMIAGLFVGSSSAIALAYGRKEMIQ